MTDVHDADGGRTKMAFLETSTTGPVRPDPGSSHAECAQAISVQNRVERQETRTHGFTFMRCRIAAKVAATPSGRSIHFLCCQPLQIMRSGVIGIPVQAPDATPLQRFASAFVDQSQRKLNHRIDNLSINTTETWSGVF